MQKLQILILFIILIGYVDNQLIRSNDVYKNVIKEVCGYYQCFSITLLHGNSDIIKSQDIEIMKKLKGLLRYFDSELFIRTAVTDIRSFVAQFSTTAFEQLVKPLFVLLDDSDDVKTQFAMLLAPLVDISRPIWIIFMRDDTSINHFFTNVHIPFNCKFMTSKRSTMAENTEIITEIYRVYTDKELNQEIFAKWNLKTGIKLPELSFNQRRTNLHGLNLQITAINYPPATIIIRNEQKQVIEIKGYCARIIDIMQSELNFTATYKIMNSVGTMSNGTWSGGLGTLINHTADIFMTNTQIISNRTNYVDYTVPLYNVIYRFYIQHSSTSMLDWDKYLMPFNFTIWLLIVCLIILATFILVLIKFLEKKIIRGVDSNLGPLSFVFAAFSVLGVLCNQVMPASLRTSIRLLQFTLHITAAILLSAYSARLISTLTVHSSNLPITTTEGLLEDGSYELGIVAGSADYLLFQNTSNQLLERVYKTTMLYESSFPANRFEGLQRVCDDNKFAFLAGQMSITHFDLDDCILIPLDIIIVAPMSMVLQHKSPFRKAINRQLNLMRESGTMAKMFHNLTIIDGDVLQVWNSVKLEDIIAPIVLLIGNTIFSICLLCTEKIVYKKSTQLKKAKMKRVVLNKFNKRMNILPPFVKRS